MKVERPVTYAGVGIVLIQSSVAATLLGSVARLGLLALGLGLIVFAAGRSCSFVQAPIVAQALLLVILGAIAFEWLSWFNSHLVFEPKLLVFRIICYVLLGCGILIGLGHCSALIGQSSYIETIVPAGMLAFTGLVAWLSLGSIVAGDGSRASFDETSPVGLAFSSGTLAVSALVVALRSANAPSYLLSVSGLGLWGLVLLQTGSRGAMGAFGVTSLLLSFVGFASAPKRVLILGAILIAVLTARIGMDGFLASQLSFTIERFEQLMNPELDGSVAGGGVSRAYLLEHNLKLPGLFVLGGEGFDPEAYPHNFEVEAFVRLGVPLGILFLAAVIYLLGCGIRMLSSRELNLGVGIILSMGLFTFFNAQTNMMWEFLRPLWLALGLLTGVALATRRLSYPPLPL